MGNVLEGQQHSRMDAILVKHLAHVQQHDASSDQRKLAVDLIPLDRHLILSDCLQQFAKLWDIPLTIFDLIEQLAANILPGELEGLIKRAARGHDALIRIEHQKRVAHGINDRVRERERDSLRKVNKWLGLRQWRN